MSAFFAAAADMAAHAIDGKLSILAGLDEVWFTIAPEGFEAFTRTAPDAVFAIITLPGWLIFGAPGLALVIASHERSREDDQDHSLFLFDELTRQAREDGYEDTGEDEDSTSFATFTPADRHYADEDVIDDLIDAPDTGRAPRDDAPPDTPQDTPPHVDKTRPDAF